MYNVVGGGSSSGGGTRSRRVLNDFYANEMTTGEVNVGIAAVPLATVVTNELLIGLSTRVISSNFG